MPEITPLTPARVAIVDPVTGGVNRPWYMFFQSLYQNILNYIGGTPSDGQVLRYNAAAQGWEPSAGLTVSNAGGITTSASLTVQTADPPVLGEVRSIVVDGKGNGSYLLLINGDADFATTATQFYASDTGVDVLAPTINLYSEGIFKVAVGGSSALSISTALNCAIGNLAATAKLDVQGNTIRLRTSRTPASATAAGNIGDICWDTSYIYVCVAANTWKRTAISTW